jgi:hypothetical protein
LNPLAAEPVAVLRTALWADVLTRITVSTLLLFKISSSSVP